ncbi:MAG: RluA family pseudouridine synthase [Candidatus Gracilibacteria bacterium]|jgi:23S rRNA pseudouridine1911/1915/1917 synthase|nr:RluA family pseudouridine synthase [Candidatus Gracilibacteria bacterium]
MIIKGDKIESFEGKRLDKALIELYPDFSRSQIQGFLKKSFVKVNGKIEKASYLLKYSDVLDVSEFVHENTEIKKQDLKLEILYEDDEKLVVYKPSGVLTHLDKNYRENTLVNGLLDKIHVEDFEDKNRPGIVHRLDKETSGLVLVCKTVTCRDFYLNEFKNRKVEKKYYAIVFGHLKHKMGIIDSPIIRDIKSRKKMSISTEKKAKPSITHFKVLNEYQFGKFKFSLLDLDLKTGRTHQIRVHLSAISHPVVGDFLYGSKKENDLIKSISKRMYLDSYRLCFNDSLSKKKLCFEKSLNNDFEAFLSKLEVCGII